VPGLRRRIGLQIYVGTAVAVLGFMAVGWPHEPMATFAIGVVSILAGRIAVAVARHWDRRSRT
jgi:hypothetical protein